MALPRAAPRCRAFRQRAGAQRNSPIARSATTLMGEGRIRPERTSLRLMMRFADLPDKDTRQERKNERLQEVLQALHWRGSITDDQQLQLFLWSYLSLFLYGLFFSTLIFRPRIVLTLKNGEVAEAPFLFVRPGWGLTKTFKAGRKLSKRNRKSLKRN